MSFTGPFTGHQVHLVLVAELVIDGLEGLAVAAPRCIELDKDVLLGVEGDLLEVLADENLDTLLVPVLGNLLAHQMRLQLPSLYQFFLLT